MSLTKVPSSMQSVPFRKNLIMNGCMRIWQRGISFAAIASGTVPADRWRVLKNTGAVTIAKQTVPLTDDLPFDSYYWIDVTTANASLAIDDYFYVIQRIEGFDVEQLRFGKEGTQDITLSFWHRHTKTGTQCVSIRNGAQDRSYVAEYTQTVTEVWERSVITIPGDTTGTWLFDGGMGLSVSFTLASGTNFHATVDTWTASSKIATSNQVNNLDSLTNYFRFTGVQLEVGNEATDFDHRPIAEEQTMCERYFSTSYGSGEGDYPGEAKTRGVAGAEFNTRNAASFTPGIRFPVSMAGVPTVVLYAPDTGSSGKISNSGDKTGVATNIASSGFRYVAITSGTTASAAYYHFTADAEL